MSSILLLSILNSVVFTYILFHRAQFKSYQLILMGFSGLIVLYTLFRYVVSQLGINPTGWDDLIYAVLYLYSSIAFIVLSVVFSLLVKLKKS